jgi:hypothetical protein
MHIFGDVVQGMIKCISWMDDVFLSPSCNSVLVVRAPLVEAPKQLPSPIFLVVGQQTNSSIDQNRLLFYMPS